MTKREELLSILDVAQKSKLPEGHEQKRGSKAWFEKEITDILARCAEEDIEKERHVEILHGVLYEYLSKQSDVTKS